MTRVAKKTTKIIMRAATLFGIAVLAIAGRGLGIEQKIDVSSVRDSLNTVFKNVPAAYADIPSSSTSSTSSTSGGGEGGSSSTSGGGADSGGPGGDGDDGSDGSDGSDGGASGPGAGGGSGSCCFPAGTKIAMADGSEKDIENILEGDEILAFDEASKENKNASVEGLVSPTREGLYVLGNDDWLKVTGDHPLYARKADGTEGWGSFDPESTQNSETYRRLENIFKIDEKCSLKKIDGQWKSVESVKYVEGEVQTYSIKRSQFHTYFANGVVAHNCA